VNTNFPGAKKILVADRPRAKNIYFRKIHFLYRQIANPFILFFFLIKQKPSFVLINDFEQSTAPIWIPFYKLFLKKHTFGIFLHDPDRDAYPPSHAYSSLSMKKIMSLTAVALYHETLPDKPYYKPNKKTTYLSVPHGIYETGKPDLEFLDFLLKEKKSSQTYSNFPDNPGHLMPTTTNWQLISILGNIRKEKNYEIAIEVLLYFPNIRLLIAGNNANSDVDTGALKRLAGKLKVNEQIIWVEKYLSESEMSSAIEASDIILLNYSNSFTSQSGILNQVAPFRKSIIVSDVESGLTSLVKKFNLGILCKANSTEGLKEAIIEILNNPPNPHLWDAYIQYASWERQVEMVLECLSMIQ
jgi:glycosyltransferase involved in cell wall biosynthesis